MPTRPAHQLSLGVRWHEDEMDRFQPIEIYDQVDGELVRSGYRSPTGSNNRFEGATALSLWAVDNWGVNEDLDLFLILRYEGVESSREQYADPQRNILESERTNETKEWLPGASFTYDLNESWQVLVGVHRGFAPLGGGAKDSEDPETSVNWEIGLRYRGSWFVEAIAFFSDFDNKVENCSNASPCSNGDTSGSYSTGQAVIAGMELQLGTTFEASRLVMPLDFMFTFTDAEISKGNTQEAIEEGDVLALIPRNTASLRFGVVADNGWGNHISAKYIDEMCMTVGCNKGGDKFDRSEDLFVLDYVSRFAVNDDLEIFLKVDNLLDERAVISRRPDGARPNKPRTASIGFAWTF